MQEETSVQISIDRIVYRLHLSPYQAFILSQNVHKYKLDKLIKRGELLYAPYRCDPCNNWRERAAKMLLGPRADLIGSDQVLVVDQRGIKLYSTGFYKAGDGYGHAYYADSQGHKIERGILGGGR